MILTLGAIWLRLLLPLLLLELHVPIMHHSSSQLVDGHFLFSGESQNIKGLLRRMTGHIQTQSCRKESDCAF